MPETKLSTLLDKSFLNGDGTIAVRGDGRVVMAAADFDRFGSSAGSAWNALWSPATATGLIALSNIDQDID